MTSADFLGRIDHLVFAAPDLDLGIEEIERVLGIRAAIGGRHPAWATRNAVLALGPRSYLEIIAPDPSQVPADGPRPFGLDTRSACGLVAWAARAERLAELRFDAARAGIELGQVMAGSRELPGGGRLAWELTDLRQVTAEGLAPFFIDWGRSVHPAARAPAGAVLTGLAAQHPDPERVRKVLRRIGVGLSVDAGPAASLIATIDCPNGRVRLR